MPVDKDETIIASGIENFSQKKARILKDRMKETDSDIQKQLKKTVEDEFAKKHPDRKNLYV